MRGPKLVIQCTLGPSYVRMPLAAAHVSILHDAMPCFPMDVLDVRLLVTPPPPTRNHRLLCIRACVVAMQKTNYHKSRLVYYE